MTLNRKSSIDLTILQVECYKKPDKYEKLDIKNDEISKKMDDLISNNHWGLYDLFNKALPEHFNQINRKVDIAWNNKIQHLDFKDEIPKIDDTIKLECFKEGKYAGVNSKQKNKIKTEKEYGKRVEFWTSNFEFFKQFHNKESLQWIIDYNRDLFYNILSYHNKNKNVLGSVNKDLKSLIRIIKLLLGEKNELRMKFSSLQMGLADLDKMAEDNNQIISSRELVTFVPYEVLFDMVEKMEENYLKKVNSLYGSSANSPKYKDIKGLYMSKNEDGKIHNANIFNIHQIILAIALNIWNFPSRSENFTMDFIEDEEEAVECKNYIVVKENQICKMIYNDEMKKHDPISYTLDSNAIKMLNTKLNLLLKYSKRTYDRIPVFIYKNAWPNKTTAVSSGTVSGWLREIIPNKNIGINTFRSAFVSYYLHKFSNTQKQALAARMRSSIDVITRSYYKKYDLPDILVQIKPEPSMELVMNASAGHSKDTGLIIGDNENESDINQVRQVPKNVYNYTQVKNIQNIQPIDNANPEPVLRIDLHERRRNNFKKWYESDENKEKKRSISKNPYTYAKRYVRELNNGLLKYEKINQDTIKKYKIKVNMDGKYYIEE